MWQRLREALGGRAEHTPGESDVPGDPRSAGTRATGGEPEPGAPDTHSTTGTTPSETFVGRSSGDDPGDSGTSGADKRAGRDDDAPPDGAAR